MESIKSKLFLIFHGRFPGEKAAALFAAKSAEAFADCGIEVVLLVPRRFGRSKETPFKYYGIKNNFRVVYLPVVDLFKIPLVKRAAFLISYFTFSKWVSIYLWFKAKKTDIIYSNEALPLLFASLVFPNTFFEVHDFPKKSFLNGWLFLHLKLAIATNRWKKNELVKMFCVPEAKILYEPNAVDVRRFGVAQGRVVQERLALSSSTVLVGYVGALKTMGQEKGIDTLLKALNLLPPNYRCLVVGGNREDVDVYRKISISSGFGARVIFTGWVRHDEVPEYLAACDVLVAPFPKTPHYDLYMSPMKVFEYMASGKPIVASDLNSIRELLSEESAYLVEPENSEKLKDALIQAATNKDEARVKVKTALEKIQNHSWQKRANRILQAIRVATL